MGSYVLTDAKVWVAQYDLSGDMNAVALADGAEIKNATTFGMQARARRAGLRTVELQCEGFVNYGVDQVDDVLFARVGTPGQAIAISPTGGAEGQPAYCFLAELARYELGAEDGEMFGFTVEAEAQGQPLVRGLVGLNGVKTATGNGTAFQLGQVAAGQKVYAGLHVLAASGGTPSVTVKVQSDTTGFPSPTDRLTFGAKAAAGFEWATLAGPITDDFWRFTWTITGTTPSFTLIGVFGIR